MKPPVQIVLPAPDGKPCRYKQHRFRDGYYAELKRNANGKKSRTVRTTFLIQHCAECSAARLVQ